MIMKSKTYTVDENMIKFSSILDDKTNNGFVIVERNDTLPYAV